MLLFLRQATGEELTRFPKETSSVRSTSQIHCQQRKHRCPSGSAQREDQHSSVTHPQSAVQDCAKLSQFLRQGCIWATAWHSLRAIQNGLVPPFAETKGFLGLVLVFVKRPKRLLLPCTTSRPGSQAALVFFPLPTPQPPQLMRWNKPLGTGEEAFCSIPVEIVGPGQSSARIR